MVSPVGLNVDDTWKAILAGARVAWLLWTILMHQILVVVFAVRLNILIHCLICQKKKLAKDIFIQYGIAATKFTSVIWCLEVTEANADRIGLAIDQELVGYCLF